MTRKFFRQRPPYLPSAKLALIAAGLPCSNRGQHRPQIWRGGASLHKVKRWLRTWSTSKFVTEKMKQRHVHPRSKRGVVK